MLKDIHSFLKILSPTCISCSAVTTRQDVYFHETQVFLIVSHLAALSIEVHVLKLFKDKCVAWGNGTPVPAGVELPVTWFPHAMEKQNTEGLLIPNVPYETATQDLPLAEHMLRYMAKPNVTIAVMSATPNKVRSETLIHAKHIVLEN